MTTEEQPITRSELREELDRVLSTMPPKKTWLGGNPSGERGQRPQNDMKGTVIQVIIGLAGLQLIGLGAVAAIMKLLGD